MKFSSPDFNNAAATLLAAGANPDKATKEGETPLLFALKHKLPHTAKRLLEQGADPGLRLNPACYTPLEAATHMCPGATGSILWAISERLRKEKEALEEKEHLDKWTKDGCPTADTAKPMPVLKLKARAP